MRLISSARTRRLGRSVLIAVLLCGAAGAAMAAPKTAKSPDPRDAKIEMLEQQLQQMNSELTELRQNGGASSERLDAMQAQMNAFGQALNEMKGQTDAATASIQTLQLPPAANTVTPTLPNGRLTLATAATIFFNMVFS